MEMLSGGGVTSQKVSPGSTVTGMDTKSDNPFARSKSKFDLGSPRMQPDFSVFSLTSRSTADTKF